MKPIEERVVEKAVGPGAAGQWIVVLVKKNK